MSGFSPIKLPSPKFRGKILEEINLGRRSHRAYRNKPLTLKEISQVLFSGQGVIDPSGRRTVPSAGALYPLDLYLLAGNATGISPGVYNVQPQDHSLNKILSGNIRKKMFEIAHSQLWVRDAAATIIITANVNKTVLKYGKPGEKFVAIEVGHTAQNISLQADSLGLGTVCVGGFDNKKLDKLLRLGKEEKSFYLITVGKIFKNYSKKEREILNDFRNLLIEKYAK